jgi:hypothetical protein
MEQLAGLENHPLAHQFPCRVPVWWGRYGDVEKDPYERGVSARKVVLRIPKQFKRFEGVLARWFRAPKELRRPLDAMNSLVWELCDGSRTFAEICMILDRTYQEAISPVLQRTTAALRLFESQHLMLLLEEPLEQRWRVGPGITPSHQQLETLDEALLIDVQPLVDEAP